MIIILYHTLIIAITFFELGVLTKLPYELKRERKKGSFLTRGINRNNTKRKTQIYYLNTYCRNDNKGKKI